MARQRAAASRRRRHRCAGGGQPGGGSQLAAAHMMYLKKQGQSMHPVRSTLSVLSAAGVREGVYSTARGALGLCAVG